MPVVASQNDIFQVKIVGRQEGQLTNNVLYFGCMSGAGDTDVDLHLIQVLANCFITHLLPVLSSAWTLEKFTFQKCSPVVGLLYEAVPVGAGAGGGNAAALPSFCSAVLGIRTARPGRSGRGRMSLAGIPENQTTNSQIDTNLPLWAGLIAFAGCVAAAFLVHDPPGTNAWTQMVYARKLGTNKMPFPLAAFAGMVDITPSTKVGTINSRKIGRGA